MNANSSSTTNTVKFKRRCMTAPVGPLHARALQQRQSEQSRVTSSFDAALCLPRAECSSSGGSQSSPPKAARWRAAKRGWHSCASAHDERSPRDSRRRACALGVRNVRTDRPAALEKMYRRGPCRTARGAPGPPGRAGPACPWICVRAPSSLRCSFAHAVGPAPARVHTRALDGALRRCR